MCAMTVKCGFCKQLVKTANSVWTSGYGIVHKSCYDSIKGRNRNFTSKRR